MNARKTKYSTADYRRLTQIKFENTSGAVSPEIHLRLSAFICGWSLFRVNSQPGAPQAWRRQVYSRFVF
jgi:hypothetical protein